MCGIFGYIGKPPVAELDEFRSFLTRLATLTSERGMHATGFVAYYNENARRDPIVAYHKAPQRASSYVQSKRWKNLLDAIPDSFVGHCRYSTGGSPHVNRNNHPFVGDRFAIVHNGHVLNVSTVESLYEIGHRRQTATDSEVILHLMELCNDLTLGGEEVLLSGEGGIAVAALDREDGRVALFRNERKPLVFVYVPRWRSLVYASTETILARALTGSRSYGLDRAAYYGSGFSFGTSTGGRKPLGVRGITDWYDDPSLFGPGAGSRGIRVANTIRDPRGFSYPKTTPNHLVEASRRIREIEVGRVYEFDFRLTHEFKIAA